MIAQAYLRLEELTKRFDETTAVDRVSLEVEEGKLLAVVGPSGCGKTTLLRLIAGLEAPDEGDIYLGGKVLFSKERRVFVPAHRRQVGMVFQNYALWPHMNVFENVAYPLRVRGLGKEAVRREVGKAFSLVKLEGLERRYPHQLSGGEQQRAALARALVMHPRMLLLDEPLSNLDAKLREKMRFEIKRIQRETGATVVYVTHDQSEAMAIADRIAVMKEGRLIQMGLPRELYEHPETEFVARFIGMTNLIPCQAVESEGRKSIVLPNGMMVRVSEIGDVPEGPVMLSVRPEDIVLSRDGEGASGMIEEVVYLGNILYYRLSSEGVDLRVQAAPEEAFEAGERAYFSIHRATAINQH